jgi:hypothetical protein
MIQRIVDREYMSQQIDLEYFDNFTPCDLAARSIGKTWEEYLQALDTDMHHDLSGLEIDVSIAAEIMDWIPGRWKIAIFNDNIEQGWPHTHGLVICLPRELAVQHPSSSRVQILVHERIHVFQRIHQKTMFSGLARIKKSEALMNLSSKQRAKVRSNPDLEN